MSEPRESSSPIAFEADEITAVDSVQGSGWGQEDCIPSEADAPSSSVYVPEVSYDTTLCLSLPHDEETSRRQEDSVLSEADAPSSSAYVSEASYDITLCLSLPHDEDKLLCTEDKSLAEGPSIPSDSISLSARDSYASSSTPELKYNTKRSPESTCDSKSDDNKSWSLDASAIDVVKILESGAPSCPPRFIERCKRSLKKLWKRNEDRLHHLDGLRLIAALLLLTSTVITPLSSGWRTSQSVLYPVRSDFGLSVFMVLVGRLIVRPWTEPLGPEGVRPDWAPASHLRLGQRLLLRPFRFILPVVVMMVIQSHVTKEVALNSDRDGWSTLWSGTTGDDLIVPAWTQSGSDELIADITSLLSRNDFSVHLRDTSSMLYVTPWILQGSLYILGVALLGQVFRGHFRYVILGALGFFNWTTYSFLLPFVLGLLLADCDVSGHLRHLQTRGSKSVPATGLALLSQAFILGLIIMVVFVPQVRDNLSEGLAHIQVLTGVESATLTTGYQLVRFADVLGAALLVLLADTASPLRLLLGCRPVAFAGRYLAAGLVVVHPLALYVITPRLVSYTSTEVLANQTAVLGRVWAITLGISIALAIAFHVLLEIPSSAMGKVFVSWMLPDPSQQVLKTKREPRDLFSLRQVSCFDRRAATSKSLPSKRMH